MRNNLQKTKLFNDIIDSQNIYSAIFSVESYIYEKDLLSSEDLEMLERLNDKYDFEYIENKIISQCIKKISTILSEDDILFESSVYLRPKKLKDDIKTGRKIIEFRPLHTCSLIDLICIVAMLNKIIYEDTDNHQRKLSDLSKLIPHNFYGNIPSTEPEMIFHRWQDKYKRYTDDYMSEYKACIKNSKYLYEISLDLVNFFPSVNPGIIYNYVLEVLSPRYKDKEEECLKAVLRKLLYFKIGNIYECSQYYYTNLINEDAFKEILSNQLFYSVGIPQGLPQAYYFGNLCMIKISSIFDRVFPGKSFYYVDDSVIFSSLKPETNVNESNIGEIFTNKLHEVNKELMKLTNGLDEGVNEQCYNNRKLKRFVRLIDYTIKVHTENKSSISRISENKYGEVFTHIMARHVSNCTVEMFSTFDETEDSSIKLKIQTILEGIEKEISRIKDQINLEKKISNDSLKESHNIREYRYYLKKLSRFKRFYKLRLKIMDFREENEISDDTVTELFQRFKIDSIIDMYERKNNKYLAELESFFEIFDEDIFMNEIRFDLLYMRNAKLRDSIINKIKSFDAVLFSSVENYQSYSYFSKSVSNYKTIDVDSYLFDEYKSINRNIFLKFCSFAKVKDDTKINFIKEYMPAYLKDPLSICSIYEKPYLSLVSSPSSKIVRMTLNAIFSYVFNVKASDNFQIQQNDNRSLKYFELRILTYLKNPKFDLNEFKLFLSNVLKELEYSSGLESIDHTIFEVLYRFRRFVKQPKFIDDIIQTHKYVSGIWKNGSKFLHFYTLHNQEHAIELIKVSISILNCLDYFQISETDYYILFLACYLHDISMVLHPDIQSFVSDNFDTDLIYSEFKKEISSFRDLIDQVPKSTIKNLILDCFRKIDDYFENTSRSMHPKGSARFIRQTKDLDFLEKTIKEYVAAVSESHGYDTNNIYGLKSNARDSLISRKYIMIILRFADLMDMTKERVSVNIMNHNLQHMSETSKFHWISHSIIDSNQIHTEYCFDSQGIKTGESFLQKEYFKEEFIITIKLNTQLLTKTECNERCRYIASCELKKINGKPHIKLRISDKSTKTCHDKDSTLICKWMSKKNEYLYKEMSALQQYLNRNDNNWFDTSIIIDLELEDKDILSSEHLDIVRRYLADK